MQAVAGLVERSWVKDIDAFTAEILAPTHAQAMVYKNKPLCESEPFRSQHVFAQCTAFLVEDDVIVTAGHCINTGSRCESSMFVFNQALYDVNGRITVIDKNNLYSCSEVIARRYDPSQHVDIAIVKLDRAVVNSTPLDIYKNEQLLPDTDLTIVGHPSGLPLKIASNGAIMPNSGDSFFRATLDAFAGNSGSPVFNTETGVVAGMHISGEIDYVKTGDCWVSKKCSNEECAGEVVMRSSAIQEFITTQ